MIAVVNPMSLILGSWLVLFLLFSGLGFIIQHLLKRPVISGSLWLDAFWIGWAVSLLILQLWHFLFPVNDVIFIILCSFAILGIWIQRRYLLAILRRLIQYRMFIVIFSMILLWLSNRGIDMPVAYDTGLRDIQAVMWIGSYPVVPGLSNLFSSLAFNQSVYLYDALLDVSIWSGRSYHIATGLMMAVFLAGAVWGAIQLYRHRNGDDLRWSWITSSVLIPFVLFETVGQGSITHYLTDVTVALVGFLALMAVLDYLQFYQPQNKPDDYLIWKPAILILTGFTIKQSFVFFGISLGILMLVIWIRRGGLKDGYRHFLQIGGFVLVYGLLLGVPYMARGVITSGYIAYPQSFGRFEVDWAEPAELVEQRQITLATNTRLRYGDPDDVLGSWNWVVPWFRGLMGNVFEFILPVGLSALLLILYAVGRFQYRKNRPPLMIGLWVLIPMLVMIAVWFLSAPNIKYIKYILWINVGVLAILVILAWYRVAWRWRIAGVYALIGIQLLYIGYLIIALRAFPLSAGPNDGFYVRPTPPIKVITTLSGLELNVPDSHIKQCWDIPLPCTITPRIRIYERVPGELRHGFGLLPLDEVD